MNIQSWISHLERMTPDSRNAPSTANQEEEEFVNALGTIATRRCPNRSVDLTHGRRGGGGGGGGGGEVNINVYYFVISLLMFQSPIGHYQGCHL